MVLRTRLLQEDSRSLSFSASEIMIRCSPSIRYMGGESWKEMPTPSSRPGSPARSSSWLYPRTISIISRASTRRPAHGQPWFTVALQEGQNDGVAFQKDFDGSVLGQQLVHRIVEIQTEIRCRIQPRSSSDRVSREESRTSALIITCRTIFSSPDLLIRQQELIQRAIHGRELPHFFVGDQIDAVHRC